MEKKFKNLFFILKHLKTCMHFVFHLYSTSTHVFHHHVKFYCSYQHSSVPHVFPTPFLCNPAIHDWFPSSCWCLLVGFSSFTISFWSLWPSFTAFFHLFSRFKPLWYEIWPIKSCLDEKTMQKACTLLLLTCPNQCTCFHPFLRPLRPQGYLTHFSPDIFL